MLEPRLHASTGQATFEVGLANGQAGTGPRSASLHVMSNAFFATPDISAFVPAPVAKAGDEGGAGRGRRLASLIATLARMWIAAFFVGHLTEAQRRRLIYRWSARLLRGLAIDVRVRGEVPPGGRPLLLVANHVSWLDTYAINTLNAARFVAKREVATWPVVRTIARRFGTIFIKRGCARSAARTVGALAQALCDGHAVAAFPEATTSDGSTLLGFFPAMFEAAVRTGARVQPIAIRYRDAAGTPTRAAAFVGDMSIADSLRRVLAEPRLTVEVTFCPPIDPHGLDRRQLAQRSRAAIAEALGFGRALTPHEPLRRAA